MKKIIILISSILIANLHSFSQTNLYWKVGTNAGLDFKTGIALVNPFDTCKAEMEESNTSVCDNNGKLIFYSDAMFVYDSRDRVMPNGSNFNHSTYGDSYIMLGYYPLLKGAITIPFPNDTNKFYVFYEDLEWSISGNYLPSKLRYLIVDKSLNGGYGDVTIKDQIVIQNDTLAPGLLMAVKHGNGKDYWLIVRKYNSDVFYKVLINSLGIQTPIVQHIGNIYPYPSIYYTCSSICLDGSLLAYPTTSFSTSPIYDSQMDIYDFDRCTGDLKNYRTFMQSYYPDTTQYLSSCFSPNGRFLYVSSFTKLLQFDLSQTNIKSTMQVIANKLPSINYFYLMEVGADNKIYISPYGSAHDISLINKPDSIGLVSNVLQNQINFGTGYANGGLPNVPNFSLGAINCNVGIEEIQTTTFDAFPNPANSQIFIKNSTFNSVNIYNLLGELEQVQTVRQNSTNEIDISKLSKGLHFLKAVNEKGEVLIKKMVKE